jgi:hypothetical protein
MSENHLETCLYHLVGITEPVFKRLSATYDTPCIQGVIEIHGVILTTRYWLYVELGKNI